MNDVNDLPEKPRREILGAWGHILNSVGPLPGRFFPVPDLLTPCACGDYVPDLDTLLEALQILSDMGLAERWSQAGVTMIRLTPKGSAIAGEAIRIQQLEEAQRQAGSAGRTGG